jgi:hypothetical protein
MHPKIHVVDETWIDCTPAIVSAVVADPVNWSRWWPMLSLSVTRDRGLKGIRWSAVGSSPASRDALNGTAEIWLEPFADGVILHHYLRLAPARSRPIRTRAAARIERDLSWHARRVFWQLKDELESSAR